MSEGDLNHVKEWLDYLKERLNSFEKQKIFISTGFLIIIGLLIPQLFHIFDNYIFRESGLDFSLINSVRLGAVLFGIMGGVIILYFGLEYFNSQIKKTQDLIEKTLKREYKNQEIAKKWKKIIERERKTRFFGTKKLFKIP